MAATSVWRHAAPELRRQVGPAAWGLWFQDVEPLGLDGACLALRVPSSHAADRIQGDYQGLLHDTLRSVSGTALKVDVIVQPTPRLPDEPTGVDAREPTLDGRVGPDEAYLGTSSATEVPMSEQPPPGGGSEPDESARGGGRLQVRYTFDQFVTGANNRFAQAAALGVAETPGGPYNPLFIYGDAGLGKTHLLHAIGNYTRELVPKRRVRYVSTETFMNEFVDAIRTKTMPEFKRRFRELDVLLIDDIQFLERTHELQEEFFHTFNHVHGGGGQIVISCDKRPVDMAELEGRLRSRFEWGLVTDIQPPEFETRLAILRKKAASDGIVSVPEEVLAFIAHNIADNVRVLEGALTRAHLFARFEPGGVITLEAAQQLLADVVPPSEPRVITPDLILSETAEHFGWTVAEIQGASRQRQLVTARHIGMYVMRELTHLSYPEIARMFGRGDHSTVVHAYQKITALMAERETVFKQVNELMSRVKLGTGG